MKKTKTNTKKDTDIAATLREIGQVFARKLVASPDTKKALKLIEEQAGLAFDQEKGGELRELESRVTETEEACNRSLKALFTLEDQKQKTRSHVKVGAAAENSTSFRHWQTKDQSVFLLSLSLTAIILCTGAANLYANFMSSGEAVFLESPWIAVLLSVLLPCASVSLKFIGDYLESDAARSLYIRVVFVLTGIVVLAWTLLFSMNFHGVSGGFDLDSLGETSNMSTWLTWTQILAEMLCAAILFHVAWDIYGRYMPGASIPNPEIERLTSQIHKQTKQVEADRALRNDVRDRLTRLQSMRAAFINEQIASFHALRESWNGERA